MDVPGRVLSDAEYRALRNRNWEHVDKNTLDSQGNLIVFGSEYSYVRGGIRFERVWPCGLDVRGNSGWVFAWVEYLERDGYECLASEGLTPSLREV